MSVGIMTLEQDLPDRDLLLAMAPAELARIVLKRLAHFDGATRRAVPQQAAKFRRRDPRIT
jgi:hypothetical protein